MRQSIITLLCFLLRVPFALVDGVWRLFTHRARQHPSSIVVIKPCCLGDVIMTTPLLEVLHRAYPDAPITYVVGSWSKVVVEHVPFVRNIIDCGNIGIAGRYTMGDYLMLALKLRRQHFDLAFVLDRSPMLTLLPWLAGIPRRVGLDSLGRGFSLTDRIPVSTSPTMLQHQADIYLNLVHALHPPLDHPHMHFVPTEQERERVASLFTRTPEAYTLVAVFVGGGSNPGMELTAKRWPLDRYREIVRRLVHELHAQVLLIGGEDDISLHQSLLNGLDVPSNMVQNLAGTTSFGESAALLEACNLFIGNDSSPMHLAAAVGTPVIAIFGPTSPHEYGPYPLDEPTHISLWNNPKGRPCFFLGKMQPCEDCTCMQSVTVDEVWSATRKLLLNVSSEANVVRDSEGTR